MSVAENAPGILITGAGGFVGRWYLRALLPRLPHPLRVIVAGLNETAIGDKLEAVPLDITDRAAVGALLARVRPRAVLHLAAVAAVSEAARDPRHAWDVNFTGTLNLAEAVLRHAPGARFVFVSTGEVYGRSFQRGCGPLDEAAAMDPLNVYAATKAAADLMIGQMARDGLDAIRFRPFNHTGPGQADLYVVAALASQIARIERGLLEPVLRVGNLESKRDFLDVRDVVEAYVTGTLGAPGIEPGTAFNLATGAARSIGDVLEALLAEARIPIRVEQDPAKLRQNEVPIAAGNASRARALLGWAPKIPWETTLRDVLNTWRDAVA